MLIGQAEVDGRIVDVRIDDGRIVEMATALAPRDGEARVSAGGCALLPGLHDHHIHLNATAAALGSVRCGPPEVMDGAALRAALHQAPDEGWLRGVGYHDSVAGEIGRDWLDRNGPDRPIRIQHRSGRLWMMNSRAIEALGADAPADGRLLDRDDWLRAHLPQGSLDLSPVGARLAAHGVTGLTEVTPRNGLADYERYARAGLPQRLRVMGGLELDHAEPIALAMRGEVKLHYHDYDLPALDVLSAEVARAHTAGRSVASHCVTIAELMMMLTAIEEAGPRDGDRIEHGAIVTPDLADRIAALGLTVVSQPHFLSERGAAYRLDVADDERPFLYRLAGLKRAGIKLAAGSDAPFGGLNPWTSMAAAVDRLEGFGEDEALSPEEALALYTGTAEAPGAVMRRVAVDAIADLCLIDRNWASARSELSEVRVTATWVGGEKVFQHLNSS